MTQSLEGRVRVGIIKILLVFLLLVTVAPAEAEEIRLIVRGDDLGMTQGSLVAFERAFKEGVLTCGSTLVCAPWFEGAAALSRSNPGWCLGVHLSLVGEWRGYRWRPVLPWDKVSSIADEDGFLFGYPEELWARRPKIEEIENELRAQINLALKMRYPGSISRHALHGTFELSGPRRSYQEAGKRVRLSGLGLDGRKAIAWHLYYAG